ncbi:MAG TPA: hypothetical protein VIK01_23465 [Polyangiaceae bacterium]|jgi:hypothetical protein
MQHADEALLSVVVLELGSTWPPWLVEYQKHAPNSVVIAQSAGESGAEFARRITRKMDEIAGKDALIHAGLVVCNGALDADSVAGRQRICTSLLHVMLQKQHGELVLAGDVTANDQVRHALFALAGTLCDELRGAQVSVRVRFDSVRPAPSTSGVMPSVVPPAGDEADEERVLNGSR